MPAAPARSTTPSSAAMRKYSAAVTVGSVVAGIGYASLIERNAFAVREVTMPVLSPGSSRLKVLHISDIHMRPKHPANYLANPGHRVHGEPLPWQDLRAAFTERGWLDLTHNRRELEVGGLRIAVAGVDDPHLSRDRYDTIAGPASPAANLTLGLTHSPEPRVLDRFAADGYQLVMAGHTHGGQLCLPFYGAIVTNCDLDRSRAKGPSRWGAHTQLHVSAGIGTSPFAPLRFCCRPEATLLTLVAAPIGGRDVGAREGRSRPAVSAR